MDDYSVELDPETGLRCALYLFADVANVAEVRRKVVSGELRCCVTKASLVVDALQVAVAANRAALNAHHGRLTTRSVYTEILYCLSMSKNISRSLSEFGVGDDDRHVLVVLLRKPGEEAASADVVLECVKGERRPVSRIREYTDVNRVRRCYKIDEDELRVTSLVDAVVSRISCKEFTLPK